METEIIKKINLRGIKAELQQLTMNEEEEFQFAVRAYKIIKEFSSFLPKQHKKLGLTEFLIKNVERLFKATKVSPLENEVSRFISALSLFKSSSEVEMYRDFFLGNISIKAAKLFVKFYLEMANINPSLYENRQKLLKHLRFDIKKALSLSAIILKEDLSIMNFSNSIAGLFEKSKTVAHHITGEIFGKHIINAYVISHNINDGSGKSGPDGLWLNWNSVDPQAFEIQIPKQNNDAIGTTGTENLLPKSMGNMDNGLTIEKVNADYKKAIKQKVKKQQTNDKLANSDPNKAPELDENIVRICHKYVFEDAAAPPKPQAQSAEPVNLKGNEDIDKQLIFLRTKLEKQKLELEMQKSIWKLVLSNSKQAIKNYRELKNEIVSTEALTNAFLNVIDKNTDDWRRLFIIKNNDIEDLYRYKFLIAAILESCSQDLSKDLREFRFAHDEDDRQMDLLLGKKRGFDLHEYLTAVYKSHKMKFDADIGGEDEENNDEGAAEEDDHSFDDKREQVHQRIEEFTFPNNGPKEKKQSAKPSQDIRKQTDNKRDTSKNNSVISKKPSVLPEQLKAPESGPVVQPEETEEQREERLAQMKANLSKLKSDLVYGQSKKNKAAPGKEPIGDLIRHTFEKRD
jgi:hypothetical protein